MYRKLYFCLILTILIQLSSASIGAQHEDHQAKPAANVQDKKTIAESEPGSGVSAELAKKGFERFKSLKGNWIGTSTKGWKEEVTYETIAKESVVVSTSFDAHPNEKMFTMFHMNGDRLMLTHYCVARNQPRLVATSISEDAKRMVFTFLDATNLTSRDKGHMDKLVIEFIDENTVQSQWTWYQGGKESWMEKINLKRRTEQ